MTYCEIKPGGERIVFQESYLNFHITNRGGSPFQPATSAGRYTVRVTLRQADGKKLEEYAYVTGNPSILEPLRALAPEESQYFTLTGVFFFHDVKGGQVEVSFEPDPALSMPPTSFALKPIDVNPHPDNAWNCAGGVAKAFVLGANMLFPPTLAVSAGSQALLNLPGLFLKWQACGSGAAACGGTAIAQYLLAVVGTTPAKLIGLLADLTNGMRGQVPDCTSWVDYINAIVREFIRNKVAVNAISVQSPANILVTSRSGQRAGFLDDGSPVQEMPDSRTLAVGEGKVVLFPADEAVTVRVKGTADGTMRLNLELTGPDGSLMAAAYPDIPMSAKSTGTIDTADSSLLLQLDDDADGAADRVVHPAEAQSGNSRIESLTRVATPTPGTALPLRPAPSSRGAVIPVAVIALLFLAGGIAVTVLVRRRSSGGPR